MVAWVLIITIKRLKQNRTSRQSMILHIQKINNKNQIILACKAKMQLKPNNREKQKKLKPIKQPIKSLRPVRQIHSSHRTQQTLHLNNITSLKNDKQNRSKQVLTHSIPVEENNHKINNKEMICMDLLQQGNVQSFIDFFYISHKCLPNVMQKKNYFGQPLHIPQTPISNQEQLQFFTDFSSTLTKAQIRPESTKDQKQIAMNESNSIAFNYEDQGDYSTAAYFYQRVVELAISCKHKQYELIALLGLGKCFDQTGRKNQAIQLLEDGVDMACVLEDKGKRGEMTRLIGKELIEIYIKKAEEMLKFDVGQALESYESGLKVAQRAKQTESEARISHKIGELYYIEGRYERSIEFQQQYLNKLHQVIATQINKQTQESIEKKETASSSLKFKQMQAHASLAKCYLKLKNIDKAEQHLNEYNRMAKESKAQNYVADSSYYLAKLFQQKNQSEKAIQFYQAYFQAAKSEKQDKKDRKLVDKARVTFAIAKANKNMDKYIDLFGENDQESLRKVLDWKVKRVMK